MSEFDVYQLPEDHETIRAAVREVCDARVAPNAAEADESSEFPKASYEALRSSDFHAPHIPVEYGGAGADALATAIVILVAGQPHTHLGPHLLGWRPLRWIGITVRL